MSWRILCVCILAAASLILASCAPPPVVTSSQPAGASGTAVPQPEQSGAEEPGEAPSEAATAEAAGASEAEQPAELAPADRSAWETLKDETYGFSIAHPPYYVVEKLSEAELAERTPAPLAVIQFRDQRSDVADIDAPAFSIAIFEKKTAGSLQAWLTMNKLARLDEGWKMETYQGKSFSGVKVTAATFMAPGEFFYVEAGGRVYQLTPLGEEAAAMLDAFHPLSK